MFDFFLVTGLQDSEISVIKSVLCFVLWLIFVESSLWCKFTFIDPKTSEYRHTYFHFVDITCDTSVPFEHHKVHIFVVMDNFIFIFDYFF